jgi:hypothetical protein
MDTGNNKLLKERVLFKKILAILLCILVMLVLYLQIQGIIMYSIVGPGVDLDIPEEHEITLIIASIISLLISLFVSYKLYKFILNKWKK